MQAQLCGKKIVPTVHPNYELRACRACNNRTLLMNNLSLHH